MIFLIVLQLLQCNLQLLLETWIRSKKKLKIGSFWYFFSKNRQILVIFRHCNICIDMYFIWKEIYSFYWESTIVFKNYEFLQFLGGFYSSIYLFLVFKGDFLTFTHFRQGEISHHLPLLEKYNFTAGIEQEDNHKTQI